MSLPDRIPVSSIMTTQLVVLNTTDSLEKAEHLFKKHRIRHIPVIESEQRIVGMLSLTDLLRISFADGAYEDVEEIEPVVYEMFTLVGIVTTTDLIKYLLNQY